LDCLTSQLWHGAVWDLLRDSMTARSCTHVDGTGNPHQIRLGTGTAFGYTPLCRRIDSCLLTAHSELFNTCAFLYVICRPRLPLCRLECCRTSWADLPPQMGGGLPECRQQSRRRCRFRQIRRAALVQDVVAVAMPEGCLGPKTRRQEGQDSGWSCRPRLCEPADYGSRR